MKKARSGEEKILDGISGLIKKSADIDGAGNESVGLDAALSTGDERTFPHLSADLAIFADVKGKIIAVNGAASQWFGRKKENLAGEFIQDLVPSEHARAMGGHLEEMIRLGEPRRFEDEENGRRFETVFHPLFDEKKTVVGVAVFARDITEQRRMETVLRASEEKYRDIFDMVSVSIWEYDCRELFRLMDALRDIPPEELDNHFDRNPEVLDALVASIRLVDVNQETLRMYGAGSEEEIFRAFGKHRLPETWNTFRRLAAAYLAGGKVLKTETVNETLDGRRIDIILQVAFTKESRKTGRILFTVTDITERKRMEDRLRALTSRQQALLAAIPNIIMEVDVNKVYTWANEAGRDFFGDDVIGREAGEYFISEQNTYSVVQPLFNGSQEAVYVESLQRRKDGQPRLLAWWCRTLKDASGKVTGALSSARDITEERMLEQQLIQAQKMETVGRLAGGIAHDFNNLLTAIIGNADLALAALDSGSPEHDQVDEIRKAAIRAANLTRQLLAFSRKQIVEPRVLDLNAVIREMDKMLRRLIGGQIEMVSELFEGLWMVKIDPGQVEQVITNLAVNARDAMPEGGRLTVSTKNVTLGEEYMRVHPETAPGKYVALVVNDTGVGMDGEIKGRIFEPFFTTKEVGKGTGLGLSTCYGIVKQNMGTIEVESTPGTGTTFRVYLPAVEGACDRRETVDETTVEGGRGTVLVVENEPSVRGMVVRILRENGYHVIETADGGEAIERAEAYRGPIHAIVTDVVMPRMGGRALEERIRELRPDIRTLYMSGYTDDTVFRQGVAGERYSFIRKPFTPAEFLRKLAETIRKGGGIRKNGSGDESDENRSLWDDD